ncbi:MAG: ammonium transporter [Bacteroidetes bacterium]|nr:ammonium transporter [Bacteroidota bacterium]
MNTANIVFMILCTSLVMLMTPGLAFFYGGLASKRNILGIMMQCFVSLGVTTILWIAVGYSLCFSGDTAGIIGNLDLAFLKGIPFDEAYEGTGSQYPTYIFVAYQMMFAVITPALITGAFVNRITFKGYLIFLVFWQLLVYFPFVHMIWGGGIMAEKGVLDFAGGIVVHTIAGFAALASVIYVSKRKDQQSPPNSIPLVALGTGLLWFGWFGFNAGSALASDSVATLAFLNTQVAAAIAATTWMLVEWMREGKPKFVGFLTGAIAGLATITPAAGLVPLWAAMIIGVLAGLGCYMAVQLKNKMGWDDALDVWGVHGIGGVIGIVALGVLAFKVGEIGDPDYFQGGLLEGNTQFFIVQIVAVTIAAAWAFIFTYGMLAAINVITPVKVSDEQETSGIDQSIHGEKAYDEGVL